MTVPAWVGVDRRAGRPGPGAHPRRQRHDLGRRTCAPTFTLGQFFTLWGVRLTASCLGVACGTLPSGSTDSHDSDPRELPLATAKTIDLTVSSS